MNETALWYASVIKPSWAPPSWVFGPVWTVLYVIIAVSFGYVFYLYIQKRIGFKTLLPFLLNLAFNLAFSPLQFQLRSFALSAVDVVLVLATLVWCMKAVWCRARWVAWANLPYLAWVSFATVLQLAVTYLNLVR